MISLSFMIGLWSCNKPEDFNKAIKKDQIILEDYIIDGYTGEAVDIQPEHDHDIDEELLAEEMKNTVAWVFESWQSFSSENYDPSKYGLGFSINFRLTYIFDNYDENVKLVKEKKIASQAKIMDIKDSAVVYEEEDHTVYSQMRVLTEYWQRIEGIEYIEPVEVLIFSKYQLDNEDGWQITNVDMYPTENSMNFDELFFGFTK